MGGTKVIFTLEVDLQFQERPYPLYNWKPVLGTKLLGFSIGRGSGALKGSSPVEPKPCFRMEITCWNVCGVMFVS